MAKTVFANLKNFKSKYIIGIQNCLSGTFSTFSGTLLFEEFSDHNIHHAKKTCFSEIRNIFDSQKINMCAFMCLRKRAACAKNRGAQLKYPRVNISKFYSFKLVFTTTELHGL